MSIGTRQLAQLCRRLGTGLRAGLDPVAMWEKEQKKAGVGRFAEQVVLDLRSGESMAGAIRRCRGFFPPLLSEMIEVGEETGRLAEVLLRLADELDHRLRIRRTFIGTIVWPVIQLVMAIGVMGLMLLLLQILIPTGSPFGPNAFRNYVLAVIGFVGVVAMITLAIVQGWFGGLLTQLAMRVPVLGPTYRASAMARLTWTLAAALDAGVDARRAVRMALESTGNDYFAQHAGTAMEIIERHGSSFHDAFEATGVFDDEFLTALSNAEMSGTYAESMRRLAQEYQGQFERRTVILAQAAGYAIWVLIGMIIIGFIVFIIVKLILPPYREAFELISMAPHFPLRFWSTSM